MKKINRRDFFEASMKTGLALAGASLFPSLSFARSSHSNDPHFFLNVIIPNGLDLSYLMDARSMALTTAGIKTNYLNEDPKELSFRNAQTLVTKLFDPLLPYKDSFSVVQGIHMSPSFDGHEQNLNLLLTGNPFGGDFFLPHLNLRKTPLDAVSNGRFIATINNDSKIVPLSSEAMSSIKKTLGSSTPLGRRSALYEALEKNYLSKDFQGYGRMDLGAQALARALQEQEPLFSNFANLSELPADLPEAQAFLTSSLELLKKGAATSINLILNPARNLVVDTHSPSQAKRSEDLMKSIVAQLAEILRLLQETPYDSTHQFMDVTTFIITTEFGRTNRQNGLTVTQSGTDHNPFNNTCIIGGKGIIKNMVVGASDLHTPDEPLSGAHLQIDKEKMKIFGRPFDFKKQEVSNSLPTIYAGADYITSASIANTIYKIYGVSETFYRKNGRDIVAAPTLDVIIA